jgi:uncharacterized protein YyaL (SSP411 family)
MSVITRDTAAHLATLTAIDKSTLPADGGERFNRLIFARSPYLLQHAENPVDWYEWGDAAFARAREENLPILLSIGYATCHWCHVMAHESFEDAEVAALLNRHFVCIKVDREERPDIDDFYMAVSQALTGSGGWPLNIFMKPDRQPFMAITYLPKRGRQGMSGLMELLANLATLWRQRPDMVDKNCRSIMEALQHNHPAPDHTPPNLARLADQAQSQLQRMYDQEYGGFGNAPKFPMPIYLEWLLDQGHRQPELAAMAHHTLRAMCSGGIWDQLAGGLHRYSVDRIWLAPHFEKMLYDQAMLTREALAAYRSSGESTFRAIAEETIAWVLRDLASPEGGFCAAFDADSEGVEGTFYLWDKSEIETVLGDHAGLFCAFHGVTEEGNFEGRTILTAAESLESFCASHGLDVVATAPLLADCRATLLATRNRRSKPLRDDKIIVAWNGLMISALAQAGSQLATPEFCEAAERAATFILSNLRRADGRLLRSYLNGASEIPAFLEDYAFLADALLDLYSATLNQRWLDEARSLGNDMIRLFLGDDGFTLVGSDAEQMPLAVTSDHDGVTPSALTVTARFFIRLAWIDEQPHLADHARTALAGVAGQLNSFPVGHLGALLAHGMLATEPAIATFSGTLDTPAARSLNQELHRYDLAPLVVRCITDSGPVQLSLCLPGTCYPPVSTPTELAALLKAAGIQAAVNAQ